MLSPAPTTSLVAAISDALSSVNPPESNLSEAERARLMEVYRQVIAQLIRFGKAMPPVGVGDPRAQYLHGQIQSYMDIAAGIEDALGLPHYVAEA